MTSMLRMMKIQISSQCKMAKAASKEILQSRSSHKPRNKGWIGHYKEDNWTVKPCFQRVMIDLRDLKLIVTLATNKLERG